MNVSLLTSALHRFRIPLLWYSVGLLFYGAIIVSIWPLIDTDLYREVLATLTPVLEAMGGPTVTMGTLGGYLATESFGIFWILICSSALILYASRAIAGSVATGTVELTLAQPVSRAEFFVTRIVVLVIVDAVVVIASFIPLVIMGPAFDLVIPFDRFLMLCGVAFLFLLTIGMFTFMVSAFTRTSGHPAGIVGGILALMWMLSFAQYFMDWLTFMKPYNILTYWTPASIVDAGTFDPRMWFMYCSVIIVSAGIAYIGFLRRDLA